MYIMKGYDLVIAVYACYTVEKYKKQLQHINETWGKKCSEYPGVKVVYFLGEQKVDGFHDTDTISYVNLHGVKDDYASASYKQNLGLKHVHDNYKTKFVICVGTDTYLNIPRLLAFTDTLNAEDCLYAGGHGDKRVVNGQTIYFHSGGPGFVISWSCLEKMSPKLSTMTEDWHDVCRKIDPKEGTHYCNACDVSIAYYLQQPDINASIVKTRGEWSFSHCNYQGRVWHNKKKKWSPCCGDKIVMKNIVSCHLMTPDSFTAFTKILEENNYFVDA